MWELGGKKAATQDRGPGWHKDLTISITADFFKSPGNIEHAGSDDGRTFNLRQPKQASANMQQNLYLHYLVAGTVAGARIERRLQRKPV